MMNILLVYSEFPDTFWGSEHTFKFVYIKFFPATNAGLEKIQRLRGKFRGFTVF